MRIRKAVIPAAGRGTRFLSLTRSLPKEMLPIGQKPVIQNVVDEIRSVGIDYTLIITSNDKEIIERHFGKNKTKEGEISFIRQTLGDGLPYGLAYAIGLSEGFVSGEPFVVCLGDCVIKSSVTGSLLKRLIYVHEKHNAMATIAFEEVSWDEVEKYGIAKPVGSAGDEFQLEDIIEKPCRIKATSNLAVAARYVFQPEIFSYIRQTPSGKKGEFQITDSIRLLLNDGHLVWGAKLEKDEIRYDIGGFAGYFKAFFDFSVADEDYGEEFRKHIREHEIWQKKKL